MLTRDLGHPERAFTQGYMLDCATGGVLATSGADINGQIVDRLNLGRHYQAVEIAVIGRTMTSTQLNKKITIARKLQHGDSSDGNDMADYATSQKPPDLVFFTSALTTPMAAWSTAREEIRTPGGQYDLRGAKRFVRCVITPTMPGNTTATAAGNEAELAGALVFRAADESPPILTATQGGSTATATAT